MREVVAVLEYRLLDCLLVCFVFATQLIVGLKQNMIDTERK